VTKRLDIPRDLLKRLYYDEGLSQCQIAERLGCSDGTISHRMREYGLKVLLRRSKRVDVPRQILKRLYYDEGLSVPQVAQHLNCSEVTIRRRMRDYGMKGRNPGEYRLLDMPQELLERLYHDERLTQEEIAKRLGCDPTTVWRRMVEYGMTEPKLEHDVPQELLETLYHDKELTQAEIAERLGCSVTTVCKRMTGYGLEARPFGPVAAGAVPDDVTWEWTPEFAYAVGLITSDGTLPKQNTNDVVFASTDRDLHDAYQYCLGVCVPVKESPRGNGRKTLYATTITNQRLRSLLEDIGLTPAKSKTLGPLDVPDRFFRDFFRGCVDGDGSVMILKFDHRRYLGVLLVSGSERFIRWVRATIKRLMEVEGGLYRNQRDVWRLDYSYRKGREIAEWMYYKPDLPCLERKRSRYEEFLRLKGLAIA
jgi:DNA-binding Lrp family transcriptional regulator